MVIMANPDKIAGLVYIGITAALILAFYIRYVIITVIADKLNHLQLQRICHIWSRIDGVVVYIQS